MTSADTPSEQHSAVVPWNGAAVVAFGNTDPGMVRESNQDNFCVDTASGLYLVADGMGGRAGGEIASSMAVECIHSEVSAHLESLLNRDLSTRRNILAQTINAASLKIYERSLELPQYRGMGTTATLLWIPPTQQQQQQQQQQHGQKYSRNCIVAHVGDSRCYLLRAGLLYQITEDHSLVNEQVKAGVLKKNDPLISQMRNVITRCVGYQEEEEVDTFTLEVFENDRFLLCSDGLTNKVRDSEIARLLGQDNLAESPLELIALANSRGGEDNITVVVAHAR